MSTTITASTSVVLVATSAGAPTDHIVYFPNISTVGRLITVRDNDGQASLLNPIIISTVNNTTFNTGFDSIYINQPFGFVTLLTQSNGLYSVVNTFAFPAEQSAATIQTLTAETIAVSCNIQMIDRANSYPNSLFTSANQLILNSSFVGDVTNEELQSTVVALGTIGYLSTIPDYFPIPPKWVAVGMSSNSRVAPSNISSPIGSIQYSLDSLTWKSAKGTGGFTQCGNAIANTDYMFVAVGANETGSPNYGYIQWSMDSSNWQPSFTPLLDSTQVRTDVHYANGIWHAVGSNVLGGSNTILWSTNGTNWYPSQGEPFKSVTSGFGYATGIAYGNAVWVCSGVQNNAGANASILWSSDGSNWYPATSISWTGLIVYNVAFDGTKFICLPQNGNTLSSRNIATSLDGKTWTSLAITGGNFNNLPSYIAGNGQQWIVTTADTNKSLVYSLDGGISWQANANIATCNLNMYKPYYDGSIWWLGVETSNTQSIYYSTDAQFWNTFGVVSGFQNGGFARGFASTDGLSNVNLLLLSTVAGLETFFPASTINTNFISSGLATIDTLNASVINASLINASTVVIGTTIVSTTYEIVNNISTQNVDFLSVGITNANVMSVKDLTVSSLHNYYLSTSLVNAKEVAISSLQNYYFSTSVVDAKQVAISSLQNYYLSTSIVDAKQVTISSLQNYSLSTSVVDAKEVAISSLQNYSLSTSVVDAKEVTISSLQNYYLSTSVVDAKQVAISSLQNYFLSTSVVDAKEVTVSSLQNYYISTTILEGKFATISSLNVGGFVSINQLTVNETFTSSLRADVISTGLLFATSNFMTQINATGISSGTLRAGPTEIRGNLQLFDYGSGSGTLDLRRFNNEARIFTNNSAVIRIGANTCNNQIYCQTNGNVGIQNNNPLYTLDIGGTNLMRVGSDTIIGSNIALATSAAATFQNRSVENTLNYALAQIGTGATILNTSNGLNLQFCTGNNQMGNFQGSTSNFFLKKRLLFEESGTASAPALTWNTDVGSNTGIYRVSEDIIGFSANGTKRLEVNTGGITVDGGILSQLPSGNTTDYNFSAINGTYSVNIYTRLSDDSYTTLVDNDDSAIIFSRGGASSSGNLVISSWNNTNQGLKVMSNGRVGINTANPAQALDVAGNINASGNITATGTISGTNTIQTGMIMMWPANSPPTDWLICNGAAVSRTTYVTLWGIIGITYGAGDGVNTFNLPNLQQRFPLGASGSYNLGSNGGSFTQTLTSNQLPAHTHSITDPSHNHGFNYDTWDHGKQMGSGGESISPMGAVSGSTPLSITSNTTGITGTNSSGGGAAFDITNPYLVINYIIKT